MSNPQPKLRIGIFFGGRSREREISFAGGRTVYDNLDKGLFAAVPIFVDGLGNLIELNWPQLYKGTIRDFFPGPQLNDGKNPWQLYGDSLGQSTLEELDSFYSTIGKRLDFSDLKNKIDFAFLCLHGPYGEDGSIQGLLDWLGIPYSGSGLFASAFGIDKVRQRKMMSDLAYPTPNHLVFSRSELGTWGKDIIKDLWNKALDTLGFPFVVKAPHQGSSIGVSVLSEKSPEAFEAALLKSFFLERIFEKDWKIRTAEDRVHWINALIDVRSGIGFPLKVYAPGHWDNPLSLCFYPEQLIAFLDSEGWVEYWLEPDDAEEHILLESFIEGKEFSCIVIENQDGNPVALPPTEIRKSSNIFDYRAKYLPGISSKITPIDVPLAHLEQIRKDCERMYKAFGFEVYARLDGFINPNGEIFLNDPNTTSGMLPSSFFFHQAAEIGLNPSQFLTYIVERSIHCRLREGKNRTSISKAGLKLNLLLKEQNEKAATKIRVGVIMGGYSTERHISLESGRNVYEKLSSSLRYQPVPIFLTGNSTSFRLFELPIKYLLKDNADDVKSKVLTTEAEHPFLEQTKKRASEITERYAGQVRFGVEEIKIENLNQLVDEVFIALHGRPGEDGSLQVELEKYGIPYNGSGIESSQKTINKFETNSLLRKNGILVAGHRMVEKSDWLLNQENLVLEIERNFPYPIIAKPSDDGCSSAVKKIKTRAELFAFSELMFRENEELLPDPSQTLGLKPGEEFPVKTGYLIETLIEKGMASHFLEVTGGLLTHLDSNGERRYEIFEPSETLASGEVLSLEEKFLAGEGQNITPARFSKDPSEQSRISNIVRSVLEKTARILNVEGYCRIDAFVRVYENGDVETLIIEINSLPGMTPATCIFHQAAINGYKPVEFISSILEYGRQREFSLR